MKTQNKNIEVIPKYKINVKAEEKFFTTTDTKYFDSLKDASRYAICFLCGVLEKALDNNKFGLETFTIELFKHGKREPLKLIIKYDKIVRHAKNKIYLLLDSAEYEKIKLLFKIEPENEETDPYTDPYIWKMSTKK